MRMRPYSPFRKAALTLLRRSLAVLALVLLPWLAVQATGVDVHHALTVTLAPSEHRLAATDHVTLAEPAAGRLPVWLHAGLRPVTDTAGVHWEPMPPDAPEQAYAAGSPVPVEGYYLTLPRNTRSFTLHYSGTLHHPVTASGRDYGGGSEGSPGLITPQGAVLSGATLWYPWFPSNRLSFTLDLTLPEDWRAMTQGRRVGRQGADGAGVVERWESHTPQEEIHLVAGPYTEYRRKTPVADAVVLLYEPDADLAATYLEATEHYLALYDRLIGPYAYPKFALVENFWETGFGMPSFTLLGSRVIRLPFILHSSFPHEILHNWWGNGVYVDYDSGNWSEGLTSYLADHLIREQRGQGSAYRRSTLQRYTDYVDRDRDFPLSQFRSRHSAATQAVGYGKTLMLFHMLRTELGDAAFVDGLRTLYRNRLYETTGFEEVAAGFGTAGERDLAPLFRQWVDRTGAPQLELRDARTRPRGDEFLLEAELIQTQGDPPYELRIPVAVTLEGREQAHLDSVHMTNRRQTLSLRLPARPLRMDVDPDFDVFRRLSTGEIPPALSLAMGADRMLIVIPADASDALAQAFEALVRTWRPGRKVQQVLDTDLQSLPSDRAVWLLGWNNRFRPQLRSAIGDPVFSEDADGSVRLGSQRISETEHSLVAVVRNPDNPDQALVWLATGVPKAVPGLARKLPHYGSYSYLAFTGDAPRNILKGHWTVDGSPLSLPVRQPDGRLPHMVRAAPRPTRRSLLDTAGESIPRDAAQLPRRPAQRSKDSLRAEADKGIR